MASLPGAKEAGLVQLQHPLLAAASAELRLEELTLHEEEDSVRYYPYIMNNSILNLANKTLACEIQFQISKTVSLGASGLRKFRVGGREFWENL